MQSSSSVPVLILVLCCMVSAHVQRGIHPPVRDCNVSTDVPQRCTDAFQYLADNHRSNSTVPSPIMDTICGESCNGLDPYIGCLNEDEDYYEYLCLRQNSQYCFITTLDYTISCEDIICLTECSDDCRSCLDNYVNDISCCQMQYQRFPSITDDDSAITTDVCGNTYDTCSGGAIAVPTVLTALLLMVMAAIVV